MLRTLFTAYLEARGVIQPSLFDGLKAGCFGEVLSRVGETQTFFDRMRDTFNGDLFPPPPTWVHRSGRISGQVVFDRGGQSTVEQAEGRSINAAEEFDDARRLLCPAEPARRVAIPFADRSGLHLAQPRLSKEGRPNWADPRHEEFLQPGGSVTQVEAAVVRDTTTACDGESVGATQQGPVSVSGTARNGPGCREWGISNR